MILVTKQVAVAPFELKLGPMNPTVATRPLEPLPELRTAIFEPKSRSFGAWRSVALAQPLKFCLGSPLALNIAL